MKVKFETVDPSGLKTPALVVFLYTEDKPALTGRPELAGLKDIISPRLRKRDFTAEHLKMMTLFPQVDNGPERIIMIGLGAMDATSPEKFRQAAAKGARCVRDLKLWEAALLLPPQIKGLTDPAETAALGVMLGNYDFTAFKTKEEDLKKPISKLTLLGPEKPAGLTKALESARITAEAIFLARDLVNRPSNLLYPETLAAEAEQIAEKAGLKIRVYTQEEAREKGMGAFLAVAQGSDRPGRVIVLEYQGAAANRKPVALVGKAITFDSGGLCIKPPDSMVDMKTDMAGGAAVLSVMAAAAGLKLKINLVGLIPAAENMPSGHAFRPGDIVTSLSGQTVEIINTDAEGRLILADALTMALEYKPKAVIDVATLTGACVVALGQKCAGLMGTDEDLTQAILNAAKAAGENVWPLPLLDEYEELLKSDAADFKHVGARWGGAITAALFLKKFTPKTPWAHLDIAGPARYDKETPDTPKGASGFGVHTLIKYLKGL